MVIGVSETTSKFITLQLIPKISVLHKDWKGENKTEASASKIIKLDEKEMHGLRYIGGYVLHKLHKKINAKNCDTDINLQYSALLLAMKSIDAVDECNTTFMQKINRGGLWDITDTAADIFFAIEMIFREYIKNIADHKINIDGIIKESTTNQNIKSKFTEIAYDAELQIFYWH